MWQELQDWNIYYLTIYRKSWLTPATGFKRTGRWEEKANANTPWKVSWSLSLVSSKVASSKRGDPLEAEPVISLTPLHPDYPWHPDRCLCRDSAPHCQAPLAVPSNTHTHTPTHSSKCAVASIHRSGRVTMSCHKGGPELYSTGKTKRHETCPQGGSRNTELGKENH